MKMGKQDDADLILKLYDLRREATMREARNWFFTFNPTSAAEYIEAMMGPNGAYVRMVVSYWDMACTLVNHGAIDEAMFNEANGEHLFIFAKIEPILAEMRQQWNAPDMLKNYEAVTRRIPDNEKKLTEIREPIKMIQSMMAERAQAANA